VRPWQADKEEGREALSSERTTLYSCFWAPCDLCSLGGILKPSTVGDAQGGLGVFDGQHHGLLGGCLGCVQPLDAVPRHPVPAQNVSAPRAPGAHRRGRQSELRSKLQGFRFPYGTATTRLLLLFRRSSYLKGGIPFSCKGAKLREERFLRCTSPFPPLA